jgi:hypothetical protein
MPVPTKCDQLGKRIAVRAMQRETGLGDNVSRRSGKVWFFNQEVTFLPFFYPKKKFRLQFENCGLKNSSGATLGKKILMNRCRSEEIVSPTVRHIFEENFFKKKLFSKKNHHFVSSLCVGSDVTNIVFLSRNCTSSRHHVIKTATGESAVSFLTADSQPSTA